MDNQQFVTSGLAARILGAQRITVSKMCQQGKLKAVKLANRWLLLREDVEALAETYYPQVGRPRTKRKYTKRSPKWFQ